MNLAKIKEYCSQGVVLLDVEELTFVKKMYPRVYQKRL